MIALQELTDTTFAGRWRNATPAERRSTLTLFEECVLEGVKEPSACLKHKKLQLLQARKAAKGDAAQLLSFHAQCGLGTNCLPESLPAGSRPSLTRRLALPGDGSLARALTRLAEGQLLTFMGDSTIINLYGAAQCELRRPRDGSPPPADAPRLLRKLLVARIGYEPTAAGLDLLTARVGELAQNATRAHGGVILASVGHHFNPQHRAEFRRHASRLLELLERFGSACAACVAILATPPLTHFPTPTGSFREWIKVRDNADTAYPCAPLRDGGGGDDADTNGWRVSELQAIVRAQRPAHVLVVPLHAISRGWTDAHTGLVHPWWTRDVTPVRMASVDCLHYCRGPWLWEPVWWAIDQAVALRTST
jgi:hypothetical protein